MTLHLPVSPSSPPPSSWPRWLGKFFLVSDPNPHLYSLPLLVPMTTRVSVCLYVCLLEGCHVDMHGHMWHALTWTPLCPVTRASRADVQSSSLGVGQRKVPAGRLGRMMPVPSALWGLPQELATALKLHFYHSEPPE